MTRTNNKVIATCPFFQKECLQEKCTAFSLREKTGDWKYDSDLGDMTAPLIADQPYCSALNVFLPTLIKGD